MAKLEQLLQGLTDTGLRAEIEAEVAALKSRTRFGLVYERHLPETAIVGDVDGLKVGDHVRPRREARNGHDYRVVELSAATATLIGVNGASTDGEAIEVPLEDLLAVKPFGEPTYLGLSSLGGVRRSETRPAHAVINGENFHALQLLTLIYESQVDCIYIDPPYNTGASDWTYNNRYVDANDSYRHSKWLSMMEKRLKIARRLLKPDGVLICTIDENEAHHLGVLLETLFPNALRQMVTICINPSGASGGEGLSRVDEYAFFCFFGGRRPAPTDDDMLVSGGDIDLSKKGAQGVRWEWLMRGGNAWYRSVRPNLCYPILLSKDGTRIVKAGAPYEGVESKRPKVIDGHPVAWPVRKDGKLGIWRVDATRLTWLTEKGYAFVSNRDERRGTWTLKYLMRGTVEAIEGSGTIEVIGRGERGEVLLRVAERKGKTAKTMWYRGRHTAGGAGGTQLVDAQLGAKDLFSFPKSVYAVRDALEIAVGDRPDALILDYFAGSGTTLNATCLLNAEDGGSRRSMMVTNNEVSLERARRLNRAGHYRGDAEFEREGSSRPSQSRAARRQSRGSGRMAPPSREPT